MIKCFVLSCAWVLGIAFGVTAFCSNAFASGHIITEQLPPKITELGVKEVGRAQFSVLFFDIYTSALYTRSGHYRADFNRTEFNSAEKNRARQQFQIQANDELVVFEIDYLKAIASDDLIKRTVEQWQYLRVPEANYQAYLPKLNTLWPDIRVGDRLTLVVTPEQSQFYLNSKLLGSINAPEFGPLFLSIWLSPNTSQPQLRKQLLAGNLTGDRR